MMACRYDYSGEVGLQIATYSTPTTPGNTRLFFSILADKRSAPKSLLTILGMKNALPWLWFADHYERNAVLDGDNCFLHMQVKCHCYKS